MKTYWDLSNAERAELSEEDVRQFIRVHLMENGILEAPAIDLLSEEVPIMPKTTVFGVSKPGEFGRNDSLDIAFADAETAQRFINLQPMNLSHDYQADSVEYMKVLSGLLIEPTDVLSETAYLEFKAELEKVKANKEHNKATRRDVEKASHAIRETSEGLWQDWHSCLEHAAKLMQVCDTYLEYLELAEGNETAARAFLAKAYDEELCQEALGEEIPDEDQDDNVARS